jgi:CO/xanthine dehydrogenase Mo-binding subunit
MVIGGLLLTAGQELRHRVEQEVGGTCADDSAFRAALSRLAAQHPLEVRARYQPPADVWWDEGTFCGDAYLTYAWGCCVVALEVDTLTGEVTVCDVTAVQDVGRVINPLLATGQVEGGVMQDLGWALLENVVWEGGAMQNATMTDYVVPTTMDTPPINVLFLETLHPRVPHGAKGLGEMPVEGPAPAVVNALRQALGVHFTHIPVTPEDIFAAWEDQGR